MERALHFRRPAAGAPLRMSNLQQRFVRCETAPAIPTFGSISTGWSLKLQQRFAASKTNAAFPTAREPPVCKPAGRSAFWTLISADPPVAALSGPSFQQTRQSQHFPASFQQTRRSQTFWPQNWLGSAVNDRFAWIGTGYVRKLADLLNNPLMGRGRCSMAGGQVDMVDQQAGMDERAERTRTSVQK